MPSASLSLRRAWIEIARDGTCRNSRGRSPYGERGLKSEEWREQMKAAGSRSPYGERGLKSADANEVIDQLCRSPYGERGLKSYEKVKELMRGRRSPYGERGLK